MYINVYDSRHKGCTFEPRHCETKQNVIDPHSKTDNELANCKFIVVSEF